jgi:hypothetical protein
VQAGRNAGPRSRSGAVSELWRGAHRNKRLGSEMLFIRSVFAALGTFEGHGVGKEDVAPARPACPFGTTPLDRINMICARQRTKGGSFLGDRSRRLHARERSEQPKRKDCKDQRSHATWNHEESSEDSFNVADPSHFIPRGSTRQGGTRRTFRQPRTLTALDRSRPLRSFLPRSGPKTNTIVPIEPRRFTWI